MVQATPARHRIFIRAERTPPGGCPMNWTVYRNGIRTGWIARMPSNGRFQVRNDLSADADTFFDDLGDAKDAARCDQARDFPGY